MPLRTMAEFFLHRRKVESVFQLLGEHENDISYSVAWGLAQCPLFLHEFLHKIGILLASNSPVIRLQHHDMNGGSPTSKSSPPVIFM